MAEWNAVEAMKQTLEALIAGQYERCRFADDCELTDAGTGEVAVGWSRLRENAAAFSQIEVTFVNSVTSGNRCAIEGEYEMTHSADMRLPDRTIPATGKRIKLKACYVLTFDRAGEGASITRMTAYWNPTHMLEQIGLA